MLQGTPQFTPGQLLDAGRRAEAEGKIDFAVQFYLHLAEHFGQTPDAAEARTALARMAGVGQPRQVWEASTPAPATSTGRGRYRSGRVLAALLSGIGWLMMAGSLLAGAAGVGAHYFGVPVLQELDLKMDVLSRVPLAALAGAAMALVGQVVRAVFDQASAMRELLAIERARAGGGDQA